MARSGPSIRILWALAALLAFCGQARALEIKSVPDDFPGGKQPQVAVAPDGSVLIVLVKGDSIFFIRSHDAGKSFSAASKIADVPGLIVGMGRGPRVAATSRRILVSAPGEDLLWFLSEDGGASWAPLASANTEPGASFGGLHNVAALPDESFYAVWLGSKGNGGPEVDGARLEAKGRKWNLPVTVYASPDKSVCECCHPSVAATEGGSIVVMWRNSLAGNRDLYFAKSIDRGEHFSSAAKLGARSWPLKACPMDGGSIIATSEAGTYAIWRREKTST